MKKLITCAVLCFVMAFAFSQNAENIRHHMDKLQFMVGKWQGSGWYRSPQGTVSDFTQSEHISAKLDGLLLLVEGLGLDTEGKKVHDALAMISYDENTEQYVFNSHLHDGKSVQASGYFEEDIFHWGFDLDQGGEIRYSISYKDDIWNEKGAYSPDGTNWYPFIEMNLKRKK